MACDINIGFGKVARRAVGSAQRERTRRNARHLGWRGRCARTTRTVFHCVFRATRIAAPRTPTKRQEPLKPRCTAYLLQLIYGALRVWALKVLVNFFF